MTLNGGMTLILRYFTKFSSLRGALRKSAVEDIPITFSERNVAKASSCYQYINYDDIYRKLFRQGG